jgi:hypothetical protein
LDDEIKLLYVKILHTIVWVFFNVVIFYFLYSVITDHIDQWTWICLGLIFLEASTLLVFKKVCPITLVARKYSDSDRANFDIFLPNWLARHNKLIYSFVVFAGIIVFIFRLYHR